MVSSPLVVRTRLCTPVTSSSFRSSLTLEGRPTGFSPFRVRTEFTFALSWPFSHARVFIAITVNKNTVPLPSTGNVAAIDTGTTLIGGPSTAVAAVYSQISGSMQLTGSLAGFYGFRSSVFLSVSSLFDILFSSQPALPTSLSPSHSAEKLGPSVPMT